MINRFISVHALGFVFYSMVHLANWITNGLPERFPKLKVLWVESGLAWVPFMMQRFDNEYMMRSSEAPALKRKPSEYMRDMYFSSQPMEMTDMAVLEQTFRMIGAETQLLYSSDYPHLGLRFAIDDLRSAVPDRAGETEYPWRQCDEGVQSQAASTKTGPRGINSRRKGGQRAHIIWQGLFAALLIASGGIRAGRGRRFSEQADQDHRVRARRRRRRHRDPHRRRRTAPEAGPAGHR